MPTPIQKVLSETVKNFNDMESLGLFSPAPDSSKATYKGFLCSQLHFLLKAVVEEIEGMKKLKGATPDTVDVKGVLPITDPQMLKGYLLGLYELQSHITSYIK